MNHHHFYFYILAYLVDIIYLIHVSMLATFFTAAITFLFSCGFVLAMAIMMMCGHEMKTNLSQR